MISVLLDVLLKKNVLLVYYNCIIGVLLLKIRFLTVFLLVHIV